jgi:tetratricopeptide (TPR) repeat protein
VFFFNLFLSLLFALGVFLHSGHLQAQGDNMNRAREAFDKGLSEFEQENFASALEHYSQSLEAFPHFRTIFNIALCYEKLGNFKDAVDMYVRYVDWPSEVPDREEVEKKIEELRALLPPEPEPEPEPEIATETGSNTENMKESETVPEPEEPVRNLAPAGWGITGTGIAGVVVGGILLGVASGKAGEMRDIEKNDEPFDPDKHEDIQDSGKKTELVGWIVGGVGIAVVAAGVVMLLVNPYKEKKDSPSVSVAFGGDDNSVSTALSWRF